MISVAIVVSTAVTWRISLTTTTDAFNNMSDVLRQEVITSSASTTKDFLDSLSSASASAFKCIDVSSPSFNRTAMITNIPSCMWYNIYSFHEVLSIFLMTTDELFAVYRRRGPESLLLNTSITVGFPAPPEDPFAAIYLYVPDAKTGMPLMDGKLVKVCTVGACPPAMDPKVYIAPLPNMKKHPLWLAGQALAHGQMVLNVTMALSGIWEPILYQAVTFRDPATDAMLAVMAISYQSERIKRFLQGLRVVAEMGAVMFITGGPALHILSSTHGAVAIPPSAGAIQALPLSATSSNDEIVQFTSWYMNSTHGGDMFERHLDVRIHVPSRGSFHLITEPFTHSGLILVTFLVVPFEAFRGEIDKSRPTSIKWTVGIAALIFVVGVASILSSTFFMSRAMRFITRQNEMLTKQLRLYTSESASNTSNGWNKLDMGTANEKLRALVMGMRPGQALTSGQVAVMRELVTGASPEDMHIPQFLRVMQGSKDGNQVLDRETGNWLTIMTHVGSPRLRRRTRSFTEPVPPRSSASTFRGGDVDSPRVSESCRGTRRSSWIVPTQESPTGISPRANPSSPGSFINHNRDNKNRDDEVICSQLAVLKATAACVGRTCTNRPGAARMHALTFSPVAEASTSTEPTLAAPYSSSPEICLAVAWDNNSGKWDGNEGGGISAVVPAMAEVSGNPAEIVPDGAVVDVLAKLGSLELDTLELAVVTGGRPITFVGYVALDRAGLLSEFSVPGDKLLRYLTTLERGMRADALYHSAAHIADVTGCLYHLLAESGVGQYLRRVDVLAALVAGLVHDYKHPGVNNDYIQRTGGELAICYNDYSILENYHLAEAFRALQDNGRNFLKHLGGDTFADIRHVIIEMVLATDLKRHFMLVDTFRSRLLALPDKPWDPESESDRFMLLRMAIKVADLGHTCKPLPLHQQWTGLIVEEFYLQGDAEKAARLDVSPFMDRNVNCVPKAQHGFFHFVVLPLVESWVKAFPKSAPLLANLLENAEFWKSEQKHLRAEDAV